LEKVRQVSKITPVLQSLLIMQIKNIVELLNAEEYYRAWISLRSLIITAPPEVKKKEIDEFRKVQTEINKILNDKQLDRAQQAYTQAFRVNRYVQTHVLRLAEETMEILYKKGYLEKFREFPTGNL
jgi:DNA-binding transcriptional regulator GbsR (MarR family)